MKPEDTHVWFLDSVHAGLQVRLEAAGMSCFDGTALGREALMELAAKTPIHGLVLRSRLSLDRELLDQLPDLQWIARSGSGLDNIDVEAAHQKGIALHSSPEGNRDAVGEHTLGMLLNTLHRLSSGDASVRSGAWDREGHRGRELKHLTVGIIGYGHMGSAFAQRLAGFGCRVLAYDKYKEGWGEQPQVKAPLPHVVPVGSDVLAKEADVVSLHVPWTSETKGMVNDHWLGSWDHPIVLLNTARGAIVQTEALLRALDDGRVTHACLDVLEFEGRSLETLEGLQDPVKKQAFEALLKHPNVMMTPHVAGWTQESWSQLSKVLADKILAS